MLHSADAPVWVRITALFTVSQYGKITRIMYAIIPVGGKQAKVSEGDVLSVELIKDTDKVTYTPLLIVADDGSVVTDPAKLKKATVTEQNEPVLLPGLRPGIDHRIQVRRPEKPWQRIEQIRDARAGRKRPRLIRRLHLARASARRLGPN